MEATLLANLAQAPYRFKDESPKAQQNNNNSANGWYISTNNMNGFPQPAPVRNSPVKQDPAPIENKEQVEEEDGSEEDYTEEPVNDDNEDSKDDEDFVVMNTKFRKKPKPPVNRSNTVPKTPKKQRVCDFCGANDTPMWRRGPQGKGTLCNACGVKWSLKFRKRIPKKKDGKEPSDKSNGKMREREAPREKTLSSTRKVRSPSPTQIKKLRSRGGSSPSSPEPERDCGIITVEGDYKEYYCKYCGLTWPLSYFKNTQQFGAHCSNCSRKQRGGSGPLNDAENSDISSRDLELDYYSAVRLHKRKRELEGNPDWGEDSDEEMDAGVNVLGKLLNVVESQLMEEEKLDEIRNEIKVFKNELLIKEDTRRKLIEEVRFSVAGELLEFRRDLVNKIQARDVQLNGIFDQNSGKLVAEFRHGTDGIKELVKNAQESLNDKPEALQKLSQMEAAIMEVQKRVEAQVEDMKAKVASELKNSTVNFAFAIDAKKERIHNEIEGMKRGADSNSADTHFYLNRIEASIEHATNKASSNSVHTEAPRPTSDASAEKPTEN